MGWSLGEISIAMGIAATVLSALWGAVRFVRSKVVRPCRSAFAWARAKGQAIERLDVQMQEVRRELTLNGGGSLKDLVVATNAKVLEADNWERASLDSMPYASWKSDAHGRLIYANSACEELTGCSENDLRGHGFYNAIAPEDRARVRQEREQAIADGRDYELSLTLRRCLGNGQFENVRVMSRTIAVRDGARRVIGWFGTATRETP